MGPIWGHDLVTLEWTLSAIVVHSKRLTPSQDRSPRPSCAASLAGNCGGGVDNKQINGPDCTTDVDVDCNWKCWPVLENSHRFLLKALGNIRVLKV